MTVYTLVPAGARGTEPGVHAVVAGGEGDKQATGGELVGTLQPRFWRERARAVVEGTEWVFGKETGDLGARLAADPEHTVRMRAARVSFWTSRFDLDLEGAPGQVRGSRHRVWTRGEERIATSGRVGFWSPAPTVEVHVDLPVHQAVFLVWLEHVLARRNQSAAAP